MAQARQIAQAEEKINEQANGVVTTASVKNIQLPMLFSVKQDKDHEIVGIDGYLPHELQGLIAEYAQEALKQEDKQAATPSESASYQFPRFSFFSKYLAFMLHQGANDILDGSQASVDRVIASVKNNPSLLTYLTEGYDRLGRRVQGTLLQIAAMAGDVNICELTAEEKQYRGIVELLQEAGKLSQDDVAEQLDLVLFSAEAKQANEERSERIMAAVKKFGESLIQAKISEQQWSAQAFKDAQEKCWPAIEAFRAMLRDTLKEVIVLGYVFDTSILHQAMKWFEDKKNFVRFGGWWALVSDIFWVNGIGSLQCITSARDAQAYRRGILYVVDKHQMLERFLKDADACLFSLGSSRLGRDFFLNGCSARAKFAQSAGEMTELDILSRAKTAALQKLCGERINMKRAFV